jgi:diguanylate cyclase (GGDEF)-like protein
VARHRRSGQPLGLLLLDIDHFKAVNDTHGHPMGDAALVQVARTLQDTLRESDLIARLGGEEFAVIAVDTHLHGLGVLADRLRRAVSAVPVAADSARPITLTISIGVAVANALSDADRLFAAADRCLYGAKRSGRNRVVLDGVRHDDQSRDSSSAQRS